MTVQRLCRGGGAAKVEGGRVPPLRKELFTHVPHVVDGGGGCSRAAAVAATLVPRPKLCLAAPRTWPLSG